MNGGRPKAAPPLLDYDIIVPGGRPRAAFADDRLMHIRFRGLWHHPTFYQASPAIATFVTESRMSRLHLTCHTHKLVFYLARLWRALISSIYISLNHSRHFLPSCLHSVSKFKFFERFGTPFRRQFSMKFLISAYSAKTTEMLIYKAFRWVQCMQHLTVSHNFSMKSSYFL